MKQFINDDGLIVVEYNSDQWMGTPAQYAVDFARSYDSQVVPNSIMLAAACRKRETANAPPPGPALSPAEKVADMLSHSPFREMIEQAAAEKGIAPAAYADQVAARAK